MQLICKALTATMTAQGSLRMIIIDKAANKDTQGVRLLFLCVRGEESPIVDEPTSRSAFRRKVGRIYVKGLKCQ